MCFCANVHTFKKHRPYALLWNTQKPHTEQPGNDQKKDQNKQKKLKKQKMIILVLPSYFVLLVDRKKMVNCMHKEHRKLVKWVQVILCTRNVVDMFYAHVLYVSVSP